MQNGPVLWTSIINQLTEAFPDSRIAVAGGAVRDYKIGVKPKDIDVFIGFDGKEIDFELACLELPELKKLVPTGDLREYMNPATPDNPDDLGYAILGVYEFKYAGYPVQVIAIPADIFMPEEVVKKFDIALCEFFFTPEKGIVGTPEAEKDLKENLMTLKNNGDKTHTRYLRIARRLSNEGKTFARRRPERLTTIDAMAEYVKKSGITTTTATNLAYHYRSTVGIDTARRL